MRTGIFSAETSKFAAEDRLDHAEMERCSGLMMEAGCDGLIVAGSPGMLAHEEKSDVLATIRKVASGKPVLVTINKAALASRPESPRC